MGDCHVRILRASAPVQAVAGRLEVDEQSWELFPAPALTTVFSSSGVADKREETSLVPEIELHNKLKGSLEAPLLPLL